MSNLNKQNNRYDKNDRYYRPYRDLASDSRYLYVYFYIFYGWGLKRPKAYHFLYDSKRHKVTCRDNKGQKIRIPWFLGRVKIDDMFNFELQRHWCYYDTTDFFITMKCGDKEKQVCIQSPDTYYYKPFYWVIDTVGNDNGWHPRLFRMIDRVHKGFLSMLTFRKTK